MKKSALVFLFFIISCLCNAQNDNVHISVVFPNNNKLDANCMNILKNKLFSIATTSGVAATECSSIVMVPDVAILDSKRVEGGMRNIMSVEIGVTVTVQNIITNTVFNTLQISVKGEGYTNEAAMRTAINRIDPKLKTYSDFIYSSKEKILNYYRKNTSSIINKANTLASTQAYDEALALLFTYPESLPDYEKVAQTISKIFMECQSKNCSQLLLAARAAYSKRDYETAADIISSINPQSSCAGEAKSLLEAIKKNIDKEHESAIALEREKTREKNQLLKHSINAAKEIAVAYFNRQTKYLFFW